MATEKGSCSAIRAGTRKVGGFRGFRGFRRFRRFCGFHDVTRGSSRVDSWANMLRTVERTEDVVGQPLFACCWVVAGLFVDAVGRKKSEKNCTLQLAGKFKKDGPV